MPVLGGAKARQPLTIDLIARGAAQHAPRVAVTFGEDSLTVAEVDALSWQLARALRGPAQLSPGTPVALLIDNGLLSVPVDFACVRAGRNRVPLNSRLSPAEQAQMLAEIGIVGLSAFLWLMFVLTVESWRAFSKMPDGFYRVILAGLFSGLVGFWVHGGMDTNFYSARLGNLMWIMMGLVVAVIGLAKHLGA